MDIYGVDFSGGKDPSGKIWIAHASLSSAGDFELKHLHLCDDRLDLFYEIVNSLPGALWGLDFPFAPSSHTYPLMGFQHWEQWLQFAAQSRRETFLHRLADTFPMHEGPCKSHGLACRWTDLACQAASPLKQVQPNMRSMIYAGWKLLYYARQMRVGVYPWDSFSITARSNPQRALLCEVYPSHTARLFMKSRSPELTPIFNFMQDCGLFRNISIPDSMLTPISQDAADAIVACITLSYIYRREQNIFWQLEAPSFASHEEWAERIQEGLILRLSP